MSRTYVKDMFGKRVLTSDGVELGDVLDVQLDTESWRATFIVIRLHRSVTDRFNIDVPLVMGTKAIALAPLYVQAVAPDLLLNVSLAAAVANAVVSFETDATEHIGKGS